MPQPVNHAELVARAKERRKEFDPTLAKQTDDSPPFKIEPYVQPEAEKVRLQRLAQIQDEANKTVFDDRIRF